MLSDAGQNKSYIQMTNAVTISKLKQKSEK